MGSKHIVLIHPGQECPQLGNGRRVVEAEIGKKKVRVWQWGNENATNVSRKAFDRVFEREIGNES